MQNNPIDLNRENKIFNFLNKLLISEHEHPSFHEKFRSRITKSQNSLSPYIVQIDVPQEYNRLALSSGNYSVKEHHITIYPKSTKKGHFLSAYHSTLELEKDNKYYKIRFYFDENGDFSKLKKITLNLVDDLSENQEKIHELTTKEIDFIFETFLNPQVHPDGFLFSLRSLVDTELASRAFQKESLLNKVSTENIDQDSFEQLIQLENNLVELIALLEEDMLIEPVLSSLLKNEPRKEQKSSYSFSKVATSGTLKSLKERLVQVKSMRASAQYKELMKNKYTRENLEKSSEEQENFDLISCSTTVIKSAEKKSKKSKKGKKGKKNTKKSQNFGVQNEKSDKILMEKCAEFERDPDLLLALSKNQLESMCQQFNEIELLNLTDGIYIYAHSYKKTLLQRRVDLILENSSEFEKKYFCSDIQICAERGEDELLFFLKEKYGTLKSENQDLFTPLQLAVMSGKISTFKILLESGFDLDTFYLDGLHLIHMAIGIGSKEIVEYLLEIDPEQVNQLSLDSSLPAHYAARYNQLEIYKLLASKKNFKDRLDDNHDAAIHIAAEEGFLPFVIYLLNKKKNSIEYKNENGLNPLACSIVTSQTDIFLYLLRQDANCNIIIKNNYTLLHLACMHNNLFAAEILLRKNLDVNALSDQKMTPLHLAVTNTNLELCQLLLAYNANVNKEDHEGRTPANFAASLNALEIFKVLSESGVHKSYQLNGSSFMHCAIRNRNLSLIEFLIKENYPLDLIDNEEVSPLIYAVGYKDFNILKLWIDLGVDLFKTSQLSVIQPLHLAVQNKSIDVAKFLIEGGVPVDGLDSCHQTALHLATLVNSPELVSLLLEKNANVEIKDRSNKTPMDYAHLCGHQEIGQLLLKKLSENSTESSKKVKIFSQQEKNTQGNKKQSRRKD